MLTIYQDNTFPENFLFVPDGKTIPGAKTYLSQSEMKAEFDLIKSQLESCPPMAVHTKAR